MKLLLLEFKKYFNLALLICVLLSVILVGAVYVVSNELIAGKAIVSAFEVDVVDKDNAFEIDMLIGIFNSQKGIKNTVQLVKNDDSSAAGRLANGEIPAYITVPEKFVEHIKLGINSPFTLIGSAKYPLQLTVTNILVKAGVAFLASSQSGIYATFDYAYAQGFSYEQAMETLLYPINIEFASQMLNYQEYINENILWQTGNVPFDMHYIISFASFFSVVLSLVFVHNLKINRNFHMLCKISGMGLFKQIMLKFWGFFLINALLTLPLCLIMDIKWIFLSLLNTAFIMMIHSFFKPVSACFALILAAFYMLFVSGGVIPLVYLPSVFEVLRFTSLNYYILELYSSVNAVVFIVPLALLFVAVTYLQLRYFEFKG